MKRTAVLGLCLVCAGALGLGCDDGGTNCVPHAGTQCIEDTTYWMDSCGNQEEVLEVCRCGCDVGGLVCRTPCDCVPDCTGKECGDDGCGGSCGICTVAGEVCVVATGQCEACTPECTGRECGPDPVCGSSCGTCTAPETCDASGQCTCTPDCAGKECGDDGCGGSCGTCTAPETCDASGQCTCTPDCTGRVCGDDGCGGSCGTCTGAGEVCVEASGTCIVCTPTCDPGQECGVDSTCGASCGTCTPPETCQPDNTCACVPDCGTRECGMDPVCNTLSCGTCADNETCDADGMCQCVPNCTGKECGDDGCGGSCGTCTVQGEYCDPTGQCVAGGACPNGSITIMQVQDVNAAGHPAEDTEEFCVQGVIVTTPIFTMSGSPAFYVQDPTGGPYSGVVVWAQNLTLDPGVVQGAMLAITGTYNEYYDLTELVATQITVLGTGTVPAPTLVLPGDIMTGSATAEQYEGVLVRVQNVETMVTPFPGNDGADHGDFQVANQSDPSSMLVVGWQFRFPFTCLATGTAPNFTPCATDQREVGQQFMSITGVMDYSWSHFRLQPRYDADLELHVDPNDTDGDGVVNANDNCPDDANPLQENSDADTFGDACDNCPLVDNQDQADADGDGVGDACEQAVTGDHLMISEICGTPNASEFIELHNPTDAAIDLSQYYLWDATYFDTDGTPPDESRFYWLLASITGLGTNNDFVVRFPDGASIAAGQTITIAVDSQASFEGQFAGVTPTYALRGTVTGTTQLMVPAFTGSVGDSTNGMITNSREVVVLFKWDGVADLVQDVDYVIWGTTEYATDKSGVTVGASTYLADTAVGNQVPASAMGSGNPPSIRRTDFNEGAEVKTGGNGLTGHDETSENLNVTFTPGDPTPGAI